MQAMLTAYVEPQADAGDGLSSIRRLLAMGIIPEHTAVEWETSAAKLANHVDALPSLCGSDYYADSPEPSPHKATLSWVKAEA